jgi:hypothetical protein
VEGEFEMMIKRTMAIIATAACCGIQCAYAVGPEDDAGRFAGGYVGVNTIANWAKGTGNVATDGKVNFGAGSEAGYLWNAYGQIVGIAAFGNDSLAVTHHAKADGRPVKFGVDSFGADLVFGHPVGDWLIYVKAGVAHVAGDDDLKHVKGTSFHGGFGVSYQIAPHWTIGGEFAHVKVHSAGAGVQNESLLFKVAYHFGK